MWTATVDGFLSAVQHNTDPDLLVVRGRVKADVRALAAYTVTATHEPTDADTLIVSYPLSDYPWRVIIPREVYADYVRAQAMAVGYPNFKGAVAKVSPPHARAYANVWTDLLVLENTDPERNPEHDSPYVWATREDDWREASGTDVERPEVDDAWMRPAFQGENLANALNAWDMADDSGTRYGNPF